MNSDLYDALIAWQGGELPPGREDALLARLSADQAFRKEFAEKVLTLSLTQVAQAPDPRWLAVYEELSHVSAPPEPLAESVMAVISQHPSRFVQSWWRQIAWGSLAVAATLVLLLAGLVIRSTAQSKKTTLAVLLTGNTGDLGVSVESRTTLYAGPLQIPAGERASLMFLSGVELQVEGPGKLRLYTMDRIRCDGGRLRLHVPRGAEGFCIETPNGTVTDLGTELGINVTGNSGTKVAVFQGKAEVAVPMRGRSASRTDLVEANETVELSARKESILPGNGGNFLTAWDVGTPALLLQDDYSSTILAAGPSHYWRLNRVQSNSIPNEVGSGPALHLSGAAAVGPDHGKENRLLFPEGRIGTAYKNEPWHLGASGYAIEMWFLGTTVNQVVLTTLTDTSSARGGVAMVEFGSHKAFREKLPGCLRALLRWPPGASGGVNIYSQYQFVPYQWHHVVSQQVQGRMELFVDGHQIGQVQADAYPPEMDALISFGALKAQAQPDGRIRGFTGAMAEIALYNRPLKPEEIRHHAQMGGFDL